MVTYAKAKFKEYTGSIQASISSVESEANQYYKEGEDNSTPEVLTITFNVVDPTSGEENEYVQKFVKPLTGGKGLFQQLLDAIGYVPDLDGGEFDEQDLVGLKLILTFDKNQKGYQFVKTAVAAPVAKASVKPKISPKKVEKEDVDNDLPFD